jgi:leader peptidase (prepilin peptidase)/N-methyltransferase
MYSVLLFTIGASLGSFFSLIAVRYPYQSIVQPASKCDNCHKKILWYDNIPLLSQLWLRFQCRSCHATIPKWYWFAELAGGGLFLLLPHLSLLKMCFLILLFLLAVYDLQHMSYPIIWWVVSFPIFLLFGQVTSLVGIFLLLTFICWRFTCPFIGAGDFAVLAMAACLFGLSDILIALQLASILGVVAFSWYRNAKLPFLPFLFAGFVLVSIFQTC